MPLPLSDTLKVTLPPAVTDWETGWAMIVGAPVTEATARVAAALVTLPALLLTTTS